jgi:hypothetical protein
MPAHGSADRTSIRLRVAGHTFALDQRRVCRALDNVEPRPIRDHFVEVRGRRFPVKQALAAATGLDLSDFTSRHARSALRRLGLPLGRLSDGASSPAARNGGVIAEAPVQVGPADDAEPATDPAAALRPHRDRWVALQRNSVLTDEASFAGVVAWLRSHHVKADAVFLVPDDPERPLAGKTG